MNLRATAIGLILALLAGITAAGATPAADAGARDPADLIREALTAEDQLETRRALQLFLAAAAARPDDAFLCQKIARQYSDLSVELPTAAEKREALRQALAYSERAVALDPRNAENVLSVAICHGKLAVLSDTSEKVRSSRLIRDYAERAVALNPGYAWAHHVLGRWHLEVTLLGSAARFVVKLFHGGLPPASLDEAVRALERSVELEPAELAHHLELGFAYAAAGQATRARAAFEAGLAMPSRDKHHEPAKLRARAALAQLAGP